MNRTHTCSTQCTPLCRLPGMAAVAVILGGTFATVAALASGWYTVCTMLAAR